MAALTLGLTLGKLRELADDVRRQLGPAAASVRSDPDRCRRSTRRQSWPRSAPWHSRRSTMPPPDDTLTDHLRGGVRPAVDELTALEDPLDVLEALRRLDDRRAGAGNAGKWKRRPGKADVVEAPEGRRGRPR